MKKELERQLLTTNITGISGYNDVKYYGITKQEPPDLFVVKGLAPTYTNLDIGGVFKNVQMNWWVYRRSLFAVNYHKILDYGDLDIQDVLAINQFFLLREAEIFKEWIDNLYPEENTQINQIKYPIKTKILPYPIVWDSIKQHGSFWCNPENWSYAFPVCYYIDVSKCEIINKENNV